MHDRGKIIQSNPGGVVSSIRITGRYPVIYFQISFEPVCDRLTCVVESASQITKKSVGGVSSSLKSNFTMSFALLSCRLSIIKLLIDVLKFSFFSLTLACKLFVLFLKLQIY